MSKKLQGKVALVTGASKGIGAAIAKHLAAEGASVVVNYSSSKEGADRVVAEITKDGGNAVAVQADVSKLPDIERLLDETKKAFGSLDVLINNAGIYEFSPIEGVTDKTFSTGSSTSMCSGSFSPQTKLQNILVPQAAASSTSARSSAQPRRRTPPSTAPRKLRSMR